MFHRAKQTGPRALLTLLAFGCMAALGQEKAAPPASSAGRRWAVLVGVNHYAELQDLSHCAADARSLRDQLVASGFSKENVFVLADGAEDTQDKPSRTNIHRRIESVLARAERDDMVLVSLGGHAVYVDGRSYFCPTEASLDSPEKTMVSMDSIYRQLEASPAGQKLLLVDVCRNDPRPPDSKDWAEHARSLAGLAAQWKAVPPGIALLSSTAPGQISWEDRELGQGVFMYYLLEGLSGKADEEGNQDGNVSLGELVSYVDFRTRRWAAHHRSGYVQTPELFGNVTGDMVLVRGVVPPLAVAPFVAQQARLHQRAWSRHLGQPLELTNSTGMKLRLIPPGEFMMDSRDEQRRYDSDRPQDRVRITRAFYLGVYEVTQQEYERVMGKNPSAFSHGGRYREQVSGLDTRRFPVERVSWNDAVEFCRRLSALPGERSAGRQYRLPTEAEWEYACRAGTTTPFHFGSVLDGRQANCNGNYPHPDDIGTTGPYLERPTTVGSYNANAFGLFDMHGNVSEWCADWFEWYYEGSHTEDPTGPESGSGRAFRGGSWYSMALNCHSGIRDGWPPTGLGWDLGFRVAFTVDALEDRSGAEEGADQDEHGAAAERAVR